MSQGNSTIFRAVDARRNEQMVRAENALAGERVVASVRLVMIVMVTFVQVTSRVGNNPVDEVRRVAALVYAVAAIAAWFGVRNSPVSTRRAQTFPIFVAMVDFGFAGLMATRAFDTSGAYEM